MSRTWQGIPDGRRAACIFSWHRPCCSLTTFDPTMWYALDGEKSDGREQVLPQLQALLEFTENLERRLSVDGVDGIAGALGLYRRLKSTLDAVPDGDIARKKAEVENVLLWLEDVARGLEELKRLKDAIRS
jgi:hypothetical protein